jgi:transposase
MSSKRAGIKRRRQHSAELKARVALEAIQERRTINEIAAEYGVHPTQVSAWKRQAVLVKNTHLEMERRAVYNKS